MIGLMDDERAVFVTKHAGRHVDILWTGGTGHEYGFSGKLIAVTDAGWDPEGEVLLILKQTRAHPKHRNDLHRMHDAAVLRNGSSLMHDAVPWATEPLWRVIPLAKVTALELAQ